MTGSARDAAAAAFDDAGVSDEPGTDAPEVAGDAPEVETPAQEPVEASPEPAEPSAERLRGPDGKFAPKPKDAPGKAVEAPAKDKAPALAAVPAVPAAAPKPATPASRAPQSWKPAAREEWAKVPPSVQEEIARREQEASVAMRRDASNRQVVERLNAISTPYRGIVPGDPLQVMDAMYKSVAVLRTGTPAAKAGLLAGFIRDSGVPIEELAAALDGKAPAQQAQQQEFRDPRFDQFLAQQEEMKRHQVASEVANFASNKEFIDDVREDMVVLLAGAAQRGLPMDLEEAYNKACSMNPEVRKVVQQRDEAKSTASVNAATQRARAAAVSVRSNHAVQPEPEESSRDPRSAAARAFRRHGA